MPHHFPKDTTEAPWWCKTCNRETQHRVFDGRIAHCLEHEFKGYKGSNMTREQYERKEKQEKEKKNPKLF
jgi:hypothetical protein